VPCALCLKDVKLCKSHIIPESFYKPLYDEKHRMWKLSTDPAAHVGHAPKGVYEELLCEQCERLTQAWDDYGSKLLFGGTEFAGRKNPFGFFISGLDYKRFKLFQMSILWRATVSKRPEFQNALLARKDKGELRRMLLAEDPGLPLDFACVMLSSLKYREVLGEVVVMPNSNMRKGAGTCLFVMGGFFWVFFVPRADQEAEKYHFCLSKEGTLTIAVEEKHTEKYLLDFALDLKRSGNLP